MFYRAIFKDPFLFSIDLFMNERCEQEFRIQQKYLMYVCLYVFMNQHSG